MIWVAAALLALCALMPAALAMRRGVQVRGRVQSSVELHRAQLTELDRDLAEGRIAPAEHATAVLEVQRRLLAASEATDGGTQSGRRWPLLAGLAVVPLAALALYLVGGRPDLPAQPLAARMAEADRQMADVGSMVTQLRAALATIDPRSDPARQGETMLGDLEASRGNFAAAADAWHKALDVKFDPLLAAKAADAATRAEGHLSEASATLFRRALAAAPPDAPWRGQVEQMLAQPPVD